MTVLNETTLTPVRKTITVKAPADRAFEVFTAGMDTWWPRTHHIGKARLKKVIVEGRAGGRCYSEQTDGTECDWGSVLVWEPPHRLVIAWQISAQWQFEPDLSKSSEVEISFTAEAGGLTRVDLEHRHLERHGPGADGMRMAVDSPNGWSGTLQAFATQADSSSDGSLTVRDREVAVGDLEVSAQAIAAACRVTDAQWTFKPAADRWSIAECVEHITIVEERVLKRVIGLVEAPAGSTRPAHTDDAVVALVERRTARVVAPEAIRPSSRWPDPRSGVAAFEAARAATIDFARTTDADLRSRTAPHPLFGPLDGYQWLLACAAHSVRHLAQIEEVKTAPSFPAGA